MRVLVFGANGQVGRELARLPGVTALNRDQADLTELVEGVLGRQFGDTDLNGAVTPEEDGQTLLSNLGQPGPLEGGRGQETPA